MCITASERAVSIQTASVSSGAFGCAFLLDLRVFVTHKVIVVTFLLRAHTGATSPFSEGSCIDRAYLGSEPSRSRPGSTGRAHHTKCDHNIIITASTNLKRVQVVN